MVDLKSKNILILGYGITGRSVKACLEAFGTHPYLFDDLFDDPKTRQNDRFLGATEILKGGRRFDYYVKSPGLPWGHPVVDYLERSGATYLAEFDLLEQLGRANTKRIIAVTGTNGKSTVVDALGFVLNRLGRSVFVGGNIGRPMLDLAVEKKIYDYAVIEASSFQLDRLLFFRPDVGVILNMAPDHLDRYGSVSDYFTAKLNIARHQTAKDYLLCPSDLPVKLPEGLSVRAIELMTCQSRQDIKDQQSLSLVLGEGRLVGRWGEGAARQVDLDVSLGAHLERGMHLENLLAILSVGLVCGEKATEVEHALKSYTKLDHRLSCVRTIGPIAFYNDSKATNLHATDKALEWIGAVRPGRVLLLLGGKMKGEAYEPFIRLLGNRPNLSMFCFGELARRLEKEPGMRGVAKSKKIRYYKRMADAVSAAYKEAASEGESKQPVTILLSPGCSSFDEFQNYQARGRAFELEVERLGSIA